MIQYSSASGFILPEQFVQLQLKANRQAIRHNPFGHAHGPVAGKRTWPFSMANAGENHTVLTRSASACWASMSRDHS
jgi:hypothetical protein